MSRKAMVRILDKVDLESSQQDALGRAIRSTGASRSASEIGVAVVDREPYKPIEIPIHPPDPFASLPRRLGGIEKSIAIQSGIRAEIADSRRHFHGSPSPIVR